MQYKKLVEVYEALSKTSRRLEKIEILSKFIRNFGEDDKDLMYLLLGNIYPDYDEKKIGIGSQLIIKAFSKVTGIDSLEIINEWRNIGDLGKVSEKIMGNKKQSILYSIPLTTNKVIDNLRKLPNLDGKGSVEKKILLIAELLNSASTIESIYIVRTILGDLRIGIQESTIRDALASAFFKENERKDASEKIQNVINLRNDLAYAFTLSKKGNLSDLEKINLEVGNPVKVMLAQKSSTIREGFEIVGKPCAIEYKYDGFRILIHKDKGKIILFTRRLENITRQFPDIIEYVNKFVNGDSFILDSEAVGFDRRTRKYMPFQYISQRIKRKYDIREIIDKLPVEVNVFDILSYAGKSLLDEPFEKRTALVKKIVKNEPYKIISAKQIITSNEKKAEEFYKKALSENQEGVMLKNLDSSYMPGNRVGNMIKIKPEERDFDLVITGAEYGTGKRSGWFSSFVLSCYDWDNSVFLEIGKVGTGIKEKAEEGISFNELTEKLKPLIVKENGRNVQVKPEIVVAITYQEIQRSQNYTSGFALRFPRLNSIRIDKPVSEIANIDDVKEEFKKQDLKKVYKY